MLEKKLNISETTKSINIEKQNNNPVALAIDSVDTHNSSALVELRTDLSDIDAGIIDFTNVKSMLVMNQHDFEDNDADVLQKIIDGLGSGGVQGIDQDNIEKNDNKKVDFIKFNLEQTWKQNFDYFSKLAKDSKEEYRSSILNFIRRFKYLINRYYFESLDCNINLNLYALPYEQFVWNLSDNILYVMPKSKYQLKIMIS